MLTKIGKDQAFQLGKLLKKHYIEDLKFVDKHFSEADVLYVYLVCNNFRPLVTISKTFQKLLSEYWGEVLHVKSYIFTYQELFHIDKYNL